MTVKVRELKSHLMFGFLVLILLFGITHPVLAQSTTTAHHVVINEVDVNPAGYDSKSVIEWVELYNPTNRTMDVGGWTIGATTGIKTTYKIPEGTKIKSGGFLTYTYGPLWFPDLSSTIQLKNKDGAVVDHTPLLRDIENNAKSWQRTTDGFDTDSNTDWTFKTSTPGSSNGKTSVPTTQSALTVSVSADKPYYIFGDLVKISGKVSKKVSVPFQAYTPEEVNLVISGPEKFVKKLVFYPDTMLMFKADMKTEKALKIPEGDYKVYVEYAGATDETTFSIREKAFVPPQEEAPSLISINTDKLAYIPGEKATVTGNTSKIIPLAGMKFKVFDPNKKQVYDGTLYPDTKGKFSVTIFINTVNPVFGKYNIIATYDKSTTETSYELVPVVKEDKPISLRTDKKVYGLGDTVIITGRSNKVWIPSLDIEIVQSYASKDVKDTFVIKGVTRLEGDSTFKYQLKIPNDKNRLGDYKVKVSKDIGSVELFFKVVENPAEFEITELGPLSITTDKPSYMIGDSLVISGRVTEKKDLGTLPVKISITTADGKPIISKGDPRASAGKSQDASYSFTGIPDTSGNFEIKSGVYRNIFQKGTYHIKAAYGEHKASTSFSVEDNLDLGRGVHIIASTDKEVYGIGEVVKLTGKVSTFTAQSTYQVTLTYPNGLQVTDGVTLNNGQFSWSWSIPSYLKTFGLYKLTVSSDSDETNVFFKISKDPQAEATLPPIGVQTDKAVYSSGESVIVSGQVIKRVTGTEGLVINTRPEVVIKSENNKEIYKAMPDLNAGGEFQTSFKIVPAVFKTGQYKVIAKYLDKKAQTVFKVVDKFSTVGEVPLALLLETDKDKYLPGEIVKISGKTTKIISVSDVDITVSRPGEFVHPVAVRFDPTGSFNYDYKIPASGSLGTYTVKADTDFDTVTATFDVVSELPKEEVPIKEMPTEKPKELPPTVPANIIDKVNRVTKSSIPITMQEKNVGNKTFSPRVFEGLLRVNLGDESDVNIKVTLADGTCLIGQDTDCEISKTTREGSSLYQIVELDGENFKVRYSGAGAKVEKFTILPEDPNGTIPLGHWNVEIIKDKQISRFYYKISYTALG